jgi:tetratricopeptide (TPR) repeat protein
MKKQSIKSLSILGLAAIGIAGCNGFSKMLKNANLIHYSVTPNPLQDNGDSVAVNITAQYPAKYFAKKAAVTVTPTLKLSDGSEVALKSVNLVGDKAKGEGQKVSYDQGGSISYTAKVPFANAMKKDELDVKATLTNNKKDFPGVKIADGTIATALLIQNDDKVIAAKDNFVKTIPEHDTTRIFYVISQSNVRPAEMKSEEMKKFKDFVDMGTQQNFTWEGIDVDAYASPDGETDMNQHLADDRAKTAIKAMMETFKNMKMDVEKANKKGKEHEVLEKLPIDAKLGEEDFYKVVHTGLDWDGFKTLVQNSSIADKDLIIRVLTMYNDHDQRMKEIKNMSKTYVELANDILPKLRRAIIIINAEKKGRSDAQLTALSASHPDSLSVEELLYAATLTTDMNQKLSIYKSAEKMYGNDWRCANNAGYAEMALNKLSDADADFQQADRLSPNNPAVQNNLGVVARWKGDRKGAMAYYNKATAAGPDVSYNMGLVDIQTGNYADAATSTGSFNTFNASLAKVLNNDAAGAKSTLDASNDQSAISYYLRAVISVRSNDKEGAVANLKTAINKDASLRAMAQSDCEFLKYKDDAEFKSAIQ